MLFEAWAAFSQYAARKVGVSAKERREEPGRIGKTHFRAPGRRGPASDFRKLF